MAKLAFNRLIQELDGSGVPYAGAKLFTYQAGSSTKETTYQDSAGSTAHANPITLDSDGRIPAGVWLTEGQSYKLVLAPSDDTDPPASPIWTLDDVSGIGDTNLTIDEWVASNLTPTFVSTTSFTVTGDQTTALAVGRRVKCTVTAGTVYGVITASDFVTLTTVTVSLDSGSLDSGLSTVSLGLLRPSDQSIPWSKSWLITAKGDLIVGTASGTQARLAVGSDDEVLVADSGETPGVKWATCPDSTKWDGAAKTVSTSAASGGTDGDIWIQY